MKKLLSISFLILTTAGYAAKQLPTVKNVEVQRYIGKWYAISALPQIFTSTCLAQTAEYQILGPKKISVFNTCIKKRFKLSTIEGEAKIVNTKTNASLEVKFDNFWTNLFKVKGDYQILKLDKDYEYVLVGSNNMKSLWILARDLHMPKKIYNSYVQHAKKLGFPVERLKLSKF